LSAFDFIFKLLNFDFAMFFDSLLATACAATTAGRAMLSRGVHLGHVLLGTSSGHTGAAAVAFYAVG
jgi:hypothetical protein